MRKKPELSEGDESSIQFSLMMRQFSQHQITLTCNDLFNCSFVCSDSLWAGVIAWSHDSFKCPEKSQCHHQKSLQGKTLERQVLVKVDRQSTCVLAIAVWLPGSVPAPQWHPSSAPSTRIFRRLHSQLGKYWIIDLKDFGMEFQGRQSFSKWCF